MKVTVLGAGAWGSVLAKLLVEGGHSVTLWGHNPDHLDDLRRAHRNERYLPGIPLPEHWELETDIGAALEAAECIVVAVPSKVFHEVTASLREFQGIAVSVTKGIEYDQGLTMCGVLRQTA